MKKFLAGFVLFAAMLTGMCLTAYAGSYSSAWYVSNNIWYVKGPNSQMLKGAWLCDNAAGPGSGDNWYLIETNGQMVTAPLVTDGQGHYYSLETNHSGNYGMLRHTDGVYDGITLHFNQSHNGYFGCITNNDGINALQAKYGVYSIAHINPNNCYYTANYIKTSSSVQNNSNTTYTLNFYVNGSKWKSSTSNSDNGIYVKDYSSSLLYWVDRYDGDIYYPGDYYYFPSGRSNATLDAVFSNGYYVDYSTTYEIYYYVNGSCVRHDTSDSSPMLVKDCNYASFQRWATTDGNSIYPGQYFHFDDGETVEVLTAVLGSSTYAYDDDGYDDSWDDDWE